MLFAAVGVTTVGVTQQLSCLLPVGPSLGGPHNAKRSRQVKRNWHDMRASASVGNRRKLSMSLSPLLGTFETPTSLHAK